MKVTTSSAEGALCSIDLGVQGLLDRGAELLGRERLDQGGGEHDAEFGKLRWWRGDAGADEGKRRIDDASGLRQYGAGWCCGLDHQDFCTLQLLGSRDPDENRLVAETSDHALQQPPDFIMGLADKYLCHVSMIDRARWIPGGQVV